MVWDLLMKRVGISKYFLGYFSNGEGVDKVDTLSRNQDFDLLRQRNKQTSSISLKALKLAVFLVGSEFRLRIPFGKLLTAQEGAAGEACFA